MAFFDGLGQGSWDLWHAPQLQNHSLLTTSFHPRHLRDFISRKAWPKNCGPEGLKISRQNWGCFREKKPWQRIYTPEVEQLAPEKWWLEDYFPTGRVTFQGAMLNFGRVKINSYCSKPSLTIYIDHNLYKIQYTFGFFCDPVIWPNPYLIPFSTTFRFSCWSFLVSRSGWQDGTLRLVAFPMPEKFHHSERCRHEPNVGLTTVELRILRFEMGRFPWKVETIPKQKKCSELEVPVNIQPRISMLSHRQLQVSWCYNADSVCSELSPSTLHRHISSECFLKFPFSLQPSQDIQKSPLSPPSISMVWLLASNNWKFAAGHGVGHPEKIQAIIGFWEPLSK